LLASTFRNERSDLKNTYVACGSHALNLLFSKKKKEKKGQYLMVLIFRFLIFNILICF